uniref:Uncharacterized protein n=1 Tax=Anguilla anguilla TaxID=7936 RepID=A0A0E9V941_ANGAN
MNRGRGQPSSPSPTTPHL